MSVPTAVTAAFPRWEMVRRQGPYWVTVYKRTWKGSVVTSFVMPLFYVVAMGVLLGGYVDAPPSRLEGAPSYLAFIAPGLVAAHAMQIATGETTWPVLGNLKWNRTYFAMVGTPLAVPDVVAAHLLFVMFRIATTCAVFLLVMAPFGVFASAVGLLLALPVLVLVGLAFAGIFFAYSATIRSESGFAIIYRLLVVPLFLFSGAFFPISNLSTPLQWVAEVTPLWHGVQLCRMCSLGQWDGRAAAVHVVYLVALTGAGFWFGVRRLTRRLVV
jgi:lipooligosaccharide transport system permease protein